MSTVVFSDERRTNVISYLHKAFRALNQVRMLEDASIIYRLSRTHQEEYSM